MEMRKQTAGESGRQDRRQAMQAEEPSPSNAFVISQPLSGDDTDTLFDEREGTIEAGAAGLSVIFEQMAAYFSDRANVDDLDALSFSLHRLFCRVDHLYRTALPELLNATTSAASGQVLTDDLLHRQCTWSKLRAIQHTIRRMEPLCNLLSDATKCMLDALDLTSEDITTVEHTAPRLGALKRGDEQDWLQALDSEHWDQALRALTECLGFWQQSYSQLVLFINYFGGIDVTTSLLIQLDEVFNTLLDSSGAIFGDILPGFQAISVGDDDAVATLLFDLMQQADQLLVQFDTALEPLHTLIEHFALLSNK